MAKSAGETDRKSKGRTAYVNARLIDPETGRDEAGGLVVENGRILDLGPHLRRNAPEGASVVKCEGHLLAPGLIDAQVFTGEPGAEHRETLKTASQAAAAGGVTTVIVMPDTNPVIDQVALVDFIQRRARDNAVVHVHTMAAMTRGLEGKEMTELGLLKRAGAIAFTNGKSSVVNSRVMYSALLYARDFDALICHHTEDPFLTEGGAMNAGERASKLGLMGIPKVAETLVLERDLALVGLTQGRYHAASITCGESLAMVRAAKRRGLDVSSAVSINHLTLNENDIGEYRTFLKLRPPLRAEEDRRALVEGIAQGEIDLIVSAHDPQDADDKRRPFAEASDGAVGLETMLAAGLGLVHRGEVPLIRLLAALTTNPARRFGLDAGRLAKGAPADLILVYIGQPWVADRETLRSRSKNSPFDERTLQGRVLRTVVAGETVYQYPPQTA